MIILRAIGGFFSKIWNWIKQTAWIQPLLIVGVIFGVIFAIPSIVKGIEEASKKYDETYYTKFKCSLVGGADSEADKIIKAIQNDTAKDTYGEKFFLAFVAESCTSCETAKGGFKTLEQEFSKFVTEKQGDGFKLYTIFADEVTAETTTRETAFVQFMDRNEVFFEEAAGAGYNTEYYQNGKITDSQLEKVESCDPDEFITPTIMLLDFTDDSPSYGVSEFIFGANGDTDYKKAELLADCWMHTGDFEMKN